MIGQKRRPGLAGGPRRVRLADVEAKFDKPSLEAMGLDFDARLGEAYRLRPSAVDRRCPGETPGRLPRDIVRILAGQLEPWVTQEGGLKAPCLGRTEVAGQRPRGGMGRVDGGQEDVLGHRLWADRSRRRFLGVQADRPGTPQRFAGRDRQQQQNQKRRSSHGASNLGLPRDLEPGLRTASRVG